MAALLLAFGGTAASQPPLEAEKMFEIIEVAPELIGGMEGLLRRIEPPEGEIPRGEVLVSAVIDERGRATVVRAADCAVPDAWCAAAVRAVGESRFSPGPARGRPFKYRLTIPIRFLTPEAGLQALVAEINGRATLDKIVEVQPVLIGGSHELAQRTVLPPEAVRLGLAGRVRVGAVVGVDGIAREFVLVRGIDRDGLASAECDAADRIERNALGALAGSRFSPGTIEGEPTPMPIVLTLDFMR